MSSPYFLAVLGLLLAGLAPSRQPSAAPTLPAAIRRALPAGYAVLDAAQGDLNRDALPDWLVVLHRPDEQKTSSVIDHPTKRPLLVFVGGAGGTYTLAARTNNAVYCVDCGGMMGDPFTGLAIKKGYFTVEHYGGSAQRWTRYVTFKYDPAARTWLLHRDGSERFHALDPEHGTTTATTAKDFGRVPLAKFDIYKAAFPFDSGRARVGRRCRLKTDGEHSWWACAEWAYINHPGRPLPTTSH